MKFNNMYSSSHDAKCGILFPYTWLIEAFIKTNLTQCDVEKSRFSLSDKQQSLGALSMQWTIYLNYSGSLMKHRC